MFNPSISRWSYDPFVVSKHKLMEVVQATMANVLHISDDRLPLWLCKGSGLRTIVDNLPKALYNFDFMERVNGNEYRHKVMFRDGWVYDGDTDVVARMGSHFYMTFACGIDYPFDELQKLSDADAGRLEAALRAIQTAEAFFGDE